jgi:phosphonate transport system permease protein
VARSFHPIIVAIIFVKAIGFGALAGILALILASIGFVAKLFAEAIEEISLKQVEAVRATGASFMGVVIMAVLPQVLARFIGFSTYQLDSNLRNSTMVGIVGGGGIGGTLFSAFQRFDYDFVAAILICIIAMIMIGEVVASWLRRASSDGRHGGQRRPGLAPVHAGAAALALRGLHRDRDGAGLVDPQRAGHPGISL